MKAPRKLFEPLAIGAPRPLLELPSRLERMIHFIPPHIEKLRAKAGELAREVDVILGNLEDAIPVKAKAAAREGLIALGKTVGLGSASLWARVNALNSPWFLDDMTRLVGEIGDKLDVVMIPKVEGDWDIHFADQYLALLEARYGLKKPVLVHAILETAQGVNNVEAIAAASPRMHGRASSRIYGTIRSRAWSTPARRTGSSRSTGRSATFPTPPAARPSSATPSSWAAPAPGPCIRARSPSPKRCSRPTPPKSPSRKKSSRPCRTARAPS